MTSTPSDLVVAAREVVAGVTPGPWGTGSDFEYGEGDVIAYDGTPYPEMLPTNDRGNDGENELRSDAWHEAHFHSIVVSSNANGRHNDTAFIASARTLLPALADALEEALGEVEAAEKVIAYVAEHAQRVVCDDCDPDDNGGPLVAVALARKYQLDHGLAETVPLDDVLAALDAEDDEDPT